MKLFKSKKQSLVAKIKAKLTPKKKKKSLFSRKKKSKTYFAIFTFTK